MPARKVLPPKIVLECEHCKKLFEESPGNALIKGVVVSHCSHKCRVAGHNVTKQCEWCQKPYQIRKSKADKARFCSAPCYHDAKSLYKKTPCLYCGGMDKAGRRTRFCSYECRDGYRKTLNSSINPPAPCQPYSKRPPTQTPLFTMDQITRARASKSVDG